MDLLSALPVSLRQLQYIVAVAEFRSFRRAAEACHVAQPSLSAQVAVAERMLGVQLFERTARRVRVPPPAAPLVAQARRILTAAVFVDAHHQPVDRFAIGRKDLPPRRCVSLELVAQGAFHVATLLERLLETLGIGWR